VVRGRKQLQQRVQKHRQQLDQMHQACATVAYTAQHDRHERDRQGEILADLLASDVSGQMVRRVEVITERQRARQAKAAAMIGVAAEEQNYVSVQRLLRNPSNDPAQQSAGNRGAHRTGEVPLAWHADLAAAERRWVTIDADRRTLGYAVMQYAPLLRVLQLRHAAVCVTRNPIGGHSFDLLAPADGVALRFFARSRAERDRWLQVLAPLLRRRKSKAKGRGCTPMPGKAGGKARSEQPDRWAALAAQGIGGRRRQKTAAEETWSAEELLGSGHHCLIDGRRVDLRVLLPDFTVRRPRCGSCPNLLQLDTNVNAGARKMLMNPTTQLWAESDDNTKPQTEPEPESEPQIPAGRQAALSTLRRMADEYDGRVSSPSRRASSPRRPPVLSLGERLAAVIGIPVPEVPMSSSLWCSRVGSGSTQLLMHRRGRRTSLPEWHSAGFHRRPAPVTRDAIVVVDTGSSCVRAGIGGETAPRVIMQLDGGRHVGSDFRWSADDASTVTSMSSIGSVERASPGLVRVSIFPLTVSDDTRCMLCAGSRFRECSRRGSTWTGTV
jgi:hypothetical protein